MRAKWNRLVWLAVIFLWMGMVAEGAIFMRIPNIPGGATEKGHEGWIELESLYFGSFREGDRPYITISAAKLMDKSNPLLNRAMVNAEPLGTVQVEFLRTIADKTTLFYQITLEKAFINTLAFSGASGGGAPVENLTLVFEKITWTVTTFNNLGAPTGDIVAWWDQLRNVGELKLPGVTAELRLSGESLRQGQSVRLRWNATAGERFQLLGSSKVEATYNLMQNFTAEATGEMVIDLPSTNAALFYRLMREN